MRHRVAGRKLGRPTSHRLSLLRNQATDLFRYERIETTEAKAREVQRMAEKMVTLDKLFVELSPRFASRSGGYTRLVKLGPRRRDGAPMAVLELVL